MYLEDKPTTNISDYFESKYHSIKRSGENINLYSSLDEEYNALKNGVGFKLNLNNVLIELTGKDVLDFLHRVSTNSVSELKPFEVRNTLFLNEKGRFVDKTSLLRFENNFLLIGNRDEENRLINWINKFIITEDISISDVTDKFLLVELFGKQSESFVTMILGKENNSFSVGALRTYQIDGFDFHIFFDKLSKNLSAYKILIQKERAIDFIEYLFFIKSVFDLFLVGDDAFNLFRIKMGIPLYPFEINDKVNPYEINLTDDINFKKGCYIGQEVVARLNTYDKIQRRLFLFKTKQIIGETSSKVIYNSDGTEAGEITSRSEADQNNVQFGLALMKKKLMSADNRFFVNVDGKKNFIELCAFENAS